MRVMYLICIMFFLCSGVSAAVSNDTYLEIELNAPSTSVGGNVFFDLNIINRGDVSVFVSPRIEIFQNDKKIDVIELGDVEISGPRQNINFSFSVENYSIGEYLAVAYVDYDGKSVSTENPFKISDFPLEIVDYTKEFRGNKIEKFNIHIESLYQQPVGDVYAEVKISDFPKANFVTSTEKISSSGSVLLSGFLDTSLIDDSKVNAEIILYYKGESTSRVVELSVSVGFDYVFYLIILFVIVILCILFWRSFSFVKGVQKYLSSRK